MLERTDFEHKSMIFFFSNDGDKLSFRNENIVIKDKEGNTKIQVSCYNVFILFIVDNTTLTTGIFEKMNKFNFSICLMNRNLKIYKFITARMEGNTLLRKRQYMYDGSEIAKHIVINKISNQRKCLMKIRNKTNDMRIAISTLDRYIENLQNKDFDIQTIMGIEGSASRVYFPQMFSDVGWNGRKPRIKCDYINSTMDIGYTVLFNIIDALLNAYGFDEYCGVLHRLFYMRKSLVCDVIEPFRPVIDSCIRKNINLNIIKQSDFNIDNGKYILKYDYSKKYVKLFLEAILEYRNEMFLYIRDYYRAVMKNKNFSEYPIFKV